MILPQPSLHLDLAAAMLRHWAERPERAPFDARSDSVRNAFLHGSLAPDMGLFPRADPLISWCVHLAGSTDVGRLLLAAAKHDEARAFAWGWLAHVVADARIHPLINDGAARLLESGSVRARDRLVAHIRVELGVEGWYFGRRGVARSVPLVDALDEAGIHDVAAALRTVYAMKVSETAIRTMHRNVTVFAALCDRLAAVLAADLDAPGVPPARADFMRLPGARRLASAALPRTSPVYAFLNPVRPAPWLLDRIDAEMVSFASRMDELVSGGIAELPNYDLNDGCVVPDTLPSVRVA